MNLIKQFTFWLLTVVVCVFAQTKDVCASHFSAAEIYWECLTTGPDAGKFVFYVALYVDCSVNPNVTNPPQLDVTNVPTMTSLATNLVPGYPQDATPSECGFSCADAIQDISLNKWLFASAPTTIPGPPPSAGYTFSYEVCCRIEATNFASGANTQVTRYAMTMYPYNGQNTDSCYDSGPRFTEPPTSLRCAGYPLRYNPNAIDADLDSLSYQLIDAQTQGGTPMTYAPGFSGISPFPGSGTTLNPVTGQLEYNSSPSEAGRYSVVMAVDSWRCGQRISTVTRDMTISFIACTPNSIPAISTPNWTAPATGSGYEVTVQAGDLVNFSLSGTDNDLLNGNPQTVTFNASGAQFGSDLSNPNSDCLTTPCATVTNAPSTAIGGVSTEFNWQTSCDHIGYFDDCGKITNTYNFLFSFRDNFCPASGINVVNVAVTVVGEPIIESPDPHCASTAANGDITLSWAPVTDNNVPQSFFEYAILHSTSPNGPFQEVGTVANINAGTYIHSSANTVEPPSTTGPNYYVIRTRSGCLDSQLEAPVDTIASIFLTVTDNTTTADLSWNAVATPNLSSVTTGEYEVWRLEPGGTWEWQANTPNLFYSDPVIWCQDELITYRIELADNLPCTSVSNEDSETLNNPATPDPQPIDSVTVENELARISWLPNAQLNVVEYTVEQNNSGIWSPLFTAVGYNNTDWTNPNSNAATEVEIYRVKATNNCLITGSALSSHRTILATVVADGCNRFSDIQWTKYFNWPEGVRAYEIHASLDGSPEVLVGTVADTVFEFRHENVQEEATYCYRVVAVRDTPTRITSTSNDTCVFIYVPKRPDYGYSYETTVVSGNTGVDQFFFVDSTAGYLGFEIQRGTNPADLSNIWFVPFNPSTQYYDYTDNGARPESNSYYYSVIGIDSCDLNADTLNMTRTILLQAEANSDRTNTLIWNGYESWLGSIVGYNIHRMYNGVLEQLAAVPPTQLTYTDSIEEIIDGDGNFCYYIEAIEGIGTPIGAPNPVVFSQTSLSNEDCALQLPNIFIPNAFVPDGVNSVFKPVTVYADTDSYLLQIYDRWGNRIYESIDPEIGWDGTVGGKEAPVGAYAYLLSVVSARGDNFVKRGTITLIR